MSLRQSLTLRLFRSRKRGSVLPFQVDDDVVIFHRLSVTEIISSSACCSRICLRLIFSSIFEFSSAFSFSFFFFVFLTVGADCCGGVHGYRGISGLFVWNYVVFWLYSLISVGGNSDGKLSPFPRSKQFPPPQMECPMGF